MSRSTWVRIVATLAVMAVLASPIAPVASGQDITCEEGQVVDEETGECVEPPVDDDGIVDDASEEDAGTDPVEDAEVDDADVANDEENEEASGETIANVYLLGLACPADWDFATRTLDDAYATCSGGGDVTWSILRDGATVVTVGVGEQADLATMGADLSPGSWEIEPNGNSTGYADCVVYDATGATTNSVSQPVDGGISFDLAAGDTLDCDWFVAIGPAAADDDTTNQGLVAEDDGEEAEADPVSVGGAPINSLTVTAVACAFGYNSLSMYGTKECVLDLQEPISIEGTAVATGAGGSPDRAVTITTIDGGPMPSGNWRVELTTPSGHAEDAYWEGYIECVTTTAGGTASPVFDSSVLNYVDFFASPNDDTVCQVIMSEATPRAGATGAIVVTAVQCPPGIVPAFSTCKDPLTAPVPVGFNLMTGEYAGSFMLTAEVPSSTTATMASGAYRIHADVPDTLVAPYIDCSIKNPVGLPFSNSTTYQVDGLPGANIVIGVGHTADCTIAVSLDPLTSIVSNTVFSCPADVDPMAISEGQRAASCALAKNVPIDNRVNGNVYLTVNTGEVGTENHALSAGQNTLHLSRLTEGTVARYVSCTLMPAGGTRQTIEPAISGGTAITVKLLQNDNLDCDWFLGDATATELEPVGTDPTPTPTQPPAAEGDDDSPVVPTNGGGSAGNGGSGGGNGGSVGGTTAESPGQMNEPDPVVSTNTETTGQVSTIVIRAWTCDTTVDPASSFEQLATGCTAIDGDASWTIGGFQPGNLTIQLATDGDPVAFCSVDATDDAFDTFPEPAGIDPDGVLAVSVPPSATVFCDWFQFPAA
jgi:hypothetical protein